MVGTFLGVFACIAAFSVGMAIGYYHRELERKLEELRLQVSNVNAKLEEPEEETSAVIETTPQLIREKERKGEPVAGDDESAIVQIKTPRQVKADKDRELQKELDKLGR